MNYHFARIASCALAGVLFITACETPYDGNDGGEQSDTEQAGTSASAEADSQDESNDEDEPAEGDDDRTQSAMAPIDFPDTTVGEVSAFVVDILNAEEEIVAEDWDGRLHEDVIAELPPEQLAEVLNSGVRPGGPWVPVDYQGAETASVTWLQGQTDDLNMHVELEEESGLITTLYFGEVPQIEPAATLEEVEQRLADSPGDTRILVVEDADVLLANNEDEAAPLASTFKLYVLLALTEAIDAGIVDWDETLELNEELRSLPTGTLQNEEDGYQVTIQEAAQAMIQISDNTATDMLIDHLGRDAVEYAVAVSGHHDPVLLQPFLTTREMFQLRWGHPDRGDEWEGADEETRRGILDDIASLSLELTVGDITDGDGGPRGIEWYATAEDIAAVHVTLADYAEEQPALVEILGANPAVAVDDPWWDSLAYKGGSSFGVLTGSWHAIAGDGTTRTVVILSDSDDAAALASSLPEVFSLAGDALTLQR